MILEVKLDITKHIKQLLEYGILGPCQSPWNTLVLPVKNSGTSDYQPAKNLREVNKQVKDINSNCSQPLNAPMVPLPKAPALLF